MKQLNLTFLLTLFLSMTGVMAFAHDIEVANADGVTIYYNYNYNGIRELEVTCYYNDNGYYDDYGDWVYEQRPYSGKVAIPSTVTYSGTTYTVTRIGDEAFFNCYDGLTSVTIPSSVTSIGDYAFYNCSGLESVFIPSGVTSIGEHAFGFDSSSPEFESLASVTVEMETPAEIYSSTFPNRTNETLYVPKGCKAAYETADYWKEFKEIIEISYIVFADANVKAICVSKWDTDGNGKLSDVEAAQVYSIESGVFSNNKSITLFDELQYFTGLRYINTWAFDGCSGLKSVTIPSGVTSIGSYAFEDCSGLKSVNIPSGVTSIGANAFKDCKSLREVNYDATNCTKMGDHYSLVFEGCSSLSTLRIGENVQTIPSYAFSGCSGLTSLTIPGNVTSIGGSAFDNCTGLTSVYIGNSVTSIGNSAFYNCSGLTSVNISDLAAWCKINFVNASYNPLYYAHHLFINGEEITDLTIPSNVEKIGNYAFSYCTGLTSLNIPSSVTSIGFGYYGENAFYGCSNLAIITVDENNSKYDSRGDCNAIIETESNNLIYGCKNTVIPSSVTSIDKYAFKGCNTLRSIYIPGSIKLLSFDFEGCTSLTSITVGEGAEEIDASGFKSLKNVTITLPNSLTNIGSEAFQSCKNCTVIIGTGIKDISDSFYNTYGMTIYIHAFKRPQTYYHTFYWADNCKSYVPYGRGDAYRSGSSTEGGYYWCYDITEMPYPSLTIGSSGYATYCSNKDLDFSEVEDVKAYIATDYLASTNTLLLQRVMKIPAGEGVIVVGKPGTYDIPECTTDITYTNLLRGMSYPDYVEPTDGGYTNFIFTDSNAIISFQPIEDTTPFFAGTAYLQLSSDCLPTDAIIVEMPDEDNYVAPENMVACRGGHGTLPISMNNIEQVVGFQFDLLLPQGVTVATNSNGTFAASFKDRASDHSLSVKKVGDNLYRFASVSMNNNPFTGNEGVLLNVKLKIDESVTLGDYEIKVKDTELTTAEKEVINSTDGIATLKVKEADFGDVNGDMKVSVTDVQSIIGYILNDRPAIFIESAANVNGDTKISITDAVIVIDMILNQGSTSGTRKTDENMMEPQ